MFDIFSDNRLQHNHWWNLLIANIDPNFKASPQNMGRLVNLFICIFFSFLRSLWWITGLRAEILWYWELWDRMGGFRCPGNVVIVWLRFDGTASMDMRNTIITITHHKFYTRFLTLFFFLRIYFRFVVWNAFVKWFFQNLGDWQLMIETPPCPSNAAILRQPIGIPLRA